MSEIEEIVRGLNDVQKRRILDWPTKQEGWFTVLPSSERREFRGLIYRRGYSSNAFTQRGLAVREALLRKDHP